MPVGSIGTRKALREEVARTNRNFTLSFNLTKLKTINPNVFTLGEIRDVSIIGLESIENPYTDSEGYSYLLGTVGTSYGQDITTEPLGVFKTKDFITWSYIGSFPFAGKHAATGHVVGNTVYIYYSDWSIAGTSNGLGLITISLPAFLAGNFAAATDQGALTGPLGLAPTATNIDPWIIEKGTKLWMYATNWAHRIPQIQIFKANSHGGTGWERFHEVYDINRSENHDIWYIDGLYYTIFQSNFADYDVGLGAEHGVFAAVYGDPLLSQPITKIPILPRAGPMWDACGEALVGNYLYLFYSPERGREVIIYKTSLVDKAPIKPLMILHFLVLEQSRDIANNLAYTANTYLYAPWTFLTANTKLLEFHSNVAGTLTIEIDALGYGNYRIYDTLITLTDRFYIFPDDFPFSGLRITFNQNATVTARIVAK